MTPADAAFEGHFRFGTGTSLLSWQQTSSTTASTQRNHSLHPGGLSTQGSARAATDGAVIYGICHTVLDWKWIILLVEIKGKGEGERRVAKANTRVSLLVSRSRAQKLSVLDTFMFHSKLLGFVPHA